MKANEIKFTYWSKYGYGINAARPRPASAIIPEWFKNMDQYDDPDGIQVKNRTSNATAKKCTPMLDSMTSGYIVSLWSDVLVSSQNNFLPEITWKVRENVFSLHGPSSRDIPPPPGYEPVVFKYHSLFTMTVPSGYSVLVVPPLGHHDLPFKAIPAIIDADKPTIDVLFPVWIKSGLEGIVEKGTPIVQIIPFKRESWEASFDFMSEQDFDIHMDNNFNSKIKNHYIRNIWSKKSFK